MTEERAKEIAEALHRADEKELSEWLYILSNCTREQFRLLLDIAKLLLKYEIAEEAVE